MEGENTLSAPVMSNEAGKKRISLHISQAENGWVANVSYNEGGEYKDTQNVFASVDELTQFITKELGA